MRLLQDLITFIAPRRIQKIETLTEPVGDEEGTRIYQLFRGIQSGAITREDQIKASLYPEAVSDSAVRVLKHRLRERLVALLFFLDMKGSGQPQEAVAVYDANKYLFSGRILITLGARFAATHFLERALSIAQRYHFTSIALESSRLLLYNAVITKNLAEYTSYNALVTKYLELLNLESQADSLIHALNMHHGKPPMTAMEISETALKNARTITLFREQQDSFNLGDKYLRLLYQAHFTARNYRQAIAACQDTIGFLQEYPQLSSPLRIAGIKLRMIECYSLLRNYEPGEQCARECIELIPEGVYNWFVFMENYVLMMMQSLQFNKALELYQQAVRNSGFAKLPANNRERWYIYEMYLNYVFDSGWEFEASRKTTWFVKKFSLESVLKKVPESSKDKTGSNVALIIVQILFLLDQGKLDGIANRIDSLKIYIYRYLKSPDLVRSRLFIKLLFIMDKQGFDPALVEKFAESTFSKLMEETPDKQPSLEVPEVLPYDLLWPRILKKLRELDAV